MQNPIKLIRKKSGMSQRELADYLGLARSSLSNWEINHRFPSRIFVKKLLVLAKKYQLEDEILRWI